MSTSTALAKLDCLKIMLDMDRKNGLYTIDDIIARIVEIEKAVEATQDNILQGLHGNNSRETQQDNLYQALGVIGRED
jgi:hypothetical protein